MCYIGICALITLLTVTTILHASEDVDLHKKAATSSQLQQHNESKQNFPIPKVDSISNLAKKLAHTNLRLRVRRDNFDKVAVRKDLQTAQVETVEAAIDAEQAKDSSIEALLTNSKLKHDLRISDSPGHDGDAIHDYEDNKSSSESSKSSNGSFFSSKYDEQHKDNENTKVVEIDEIYDDDEDEEHESENNKDEKIEDDSHVQEDEDEDEQESEGINEDNAEDNHHPHSGDNKNDTDGNDDSGDDDQAADDKDSNDMGVPSHETIVEDENDGLTIESVDFDVKSRHKQKQEGRVKHKEIESESQQHERKGKYGGGRGEENGGRFKNGGHTESEIRGKNKDDGDKEKEIRGRHKYDRHRGKENGGSHKDGVDEKKLEGKSDEDRSKVKQHGQKDEKDRQDDRKKEDGHNGSTKNNAAVGDINICQGVVDLQRMSQDFSTHMKNLIDREEEVIERLERLESSLESRNSPGQIKRFARRNAQGPEEYIQPSKACVYIDENPESNSKYHPTKGRKGHPTKDEESAGSYHQGGAERSHSGHNPAGSDLDEIKIHVYTPEGVLPNPQIHPGHDQHPPFKHPQQPHQPFYPDESGDTGRIPVAEARFYPLHDSTSRRRHRRRHRSRKRVARKVKLDSNEDAHKGSIPLADIDLENIYWIKPSNHMSQESGETILNQIYKSGQDVLIIPISSKFRNIRDVANSFLDSVRVKADAAKGKTHELAKGMANSLTQAGERVENKGKEAKVKVYEWFRKGKGNKHKVDNNEVMQDERVT